MERVRLRRRAAATLAVVAAALASAAGAAADHGGRDEARARADCGGAALSLRLRVDDGRIRIDVELEARSPSRWSVVVVHERQIVYRGSHRLRRRGELELRRYVDDWFGTDRVAVRVSGGAHAACSVSATV
jgi:hypothetical protein